MRQGTATPILQCRTRASEYVRGEERIHRFFLDSGAHSIYNQKIGHHGSITPEMMAKMKKMTAMERFATRKEHPEVFRAKRKASYDYYSTKEFYDYVDTYCQFIHDYHYAIDAYATVDVLFNPKLSWKITKYIEKEWGLKPVPVIHFNTEMKWIHKHLEAGYDYIGIGGLGQEITKANYIEWADKAFNIICDQPSRLPLAKVHGFAMTAHVLLVRYPWFCMTEEDHQVMTREGWKSFSDLYVGQEILAYNNGDLRWEAITEIPNWEVMNVDITKMSGRSFEAHVTHNHEWPVIHARKDRVPTAPFKKTCDLSYADAIPRCGDSYSQVPTDKTYETAFVELVAWYYTEGSIKKRTDYKHDSIILYQSEKANKKKCEMIRKCLKKLNEKHCEGSPTERDSVIAWELYGDNARRLLSEFPNKEIPLDFIQKLTAKQLKRFMRISILADGHKRNNEMCLIQKYGKNTDAFELASLLSGLPVSHIPPYNNQMAGIRASVSEQSRKAWVSQLDFEEYKYSGRIWCITVPSHAFVTKCKNTVYITGNSVDSASWTKAGGWGRLYVPRVTRGAFDFLQPPYTLNCSVASPTKHRKGRNYSTLKAGEKEVVRRWVKECGQKMGKCDADNNVITQGVINYHGARKICNLRFYEMMINTLPEWPWPFQIQAQKRVGLGLLR